MDNLEEILKQIEANQKALIDELEKAYIDQNIEQEEKKKIEFILGQNRLLSKALKDKDLEEINNIYKKLTNADNNR